MPIDLPDEIGGLFAEDHRNDHLKNKPLDICTPKTRLSRKPCVAVIKHHVASKLVSAPVSAEDLVCLSDMQVAQRYGVSRSTIWRWAAQQQGFPSPIALSPGTSRWFLSALLSFEKALTTRPTKSGSLEAKAPLPASPTGLGDGQ